MCIRDRKKAEELGYKALTLAHVEAVESTQAARIFSSIIKHTLEIGEPFQVPVALFIGEEMVVEVGDSGGVGGRNQEYALMMASLIAVSYTHLDVYKRQHKACNQENDRNHDNEQSAPQPGGCHHIIGNIQAFAGDGQGRDSGQSVGRGVHEQSQVGDAGEP